MQELSSEKSIGILLLVLIALALFLPQSLSVDQQSLHLYAICCAAYLPALSYQLSRLKYPLSWLVTFSASIVIGGLWYFIIQPIYPASALMLSVAVACGNYIMLRIK